MNAWRGRWIVPGLLAVALLVVPACGNEGSYGPAAESTVETGVVERAATIALEIEADPDATEQILERHGITAAEFEEMMLEISKDEGLRKAYRARLGG